MMTQEYGPETDRLKFIEKRDGVEAAVEFAQDTLRTYRRFVLSKRILRPSQVSTEDAKSSTNCRSLPAERPVAAMKVLPEAKTAMRGPRKPVVHAMSAAHRHNFISSYLAFKRYVALRQSNSGD